MKNKGFTLIELLAVIVILAVIALIATPIILNVIEQSRMGSFKNSAYGLIDSAELFYISKEELEDFNGSRIEFSNGVMTIYNNDIETDEKLNFKGSSPKDGYINIYDDGMMDIKITDGKYCAYKNVGDIEVTVLQGICEGITVNGKIAISTPEQFNDIRNNLTGYYVLVNDIDLSGYPNFEPIATYEAPFNGTLDGRGKTVTNLKTSQNREYVGMFTSIYRGTIKNLAVDNAVISNTGSNANTGVISGLINDAIIDNVTVNNPNVESLGTQTGGLVGAYRASLTGKIINSTVNGGTIKGTSGVGGILGSIGTGSSTQFLKYLLDNNTVNTTVNASDSAGLLIGSIIYSNTNQPRTTITITNNYATGRVTATSIVGGLIGRYDHGLAKHNVVDNAILSASSTAGGLIGMMQPRTQFSEMNVTENLVKNTSVEIVNTAGAGFIGTIKNYSTDNENIHQVTNNLLLNTNVKKSTTGDVSGFVGIMGHTSYPYIVKTHLANNININTFNDSLGTPRGFIGMIVSEGDKDIVTYNKNFWSNVATTGVASTNPTGVEKKTEAELKQVSIYNGWDTNIWRFKEGEYPSLKGINR